MSNIPNFNSRSATGHRLIFAANPEIPRTQHALLHISYFKMSLIFAVQPRVKPTLGPMVVKEVGVRR